MMSRLGRTVLQWTAGAAITLAIVGPSRVKWTAERREDAVLRLTWRFRSEETEACRDVPPEAQERRPAHMRRARECTRGLAPYRLLVLVDGDTAISDSVAPRGARSDRPLSVFRELRLRPGPRRIRIEFERFGSPARGLTLDTALVLRTRQVAVTTLRGEPAGFAILAAPPGR